MLNHKVLWLTILVALISMPVMAQRFKFKPQKHEVGIEVASFSQVPALSGSYSGFPASPSIPSGLRYKYFLDGRWAQRWDFLAVTNLAQGSIESAQREDYRLKLGMSATWYLGQAGVFAGADAMISIGTTGLLQVDLSSGNTFQGSEGYTSYGVSLFLRISTLLFALYKHDGRVGGYYLANQYDGNFAGGSRRRLLYPAQEWGIREPYR